jgi:H+-translocating NAD(P) transhydrogenase subunit alpha
MIIIYLITIFTMAVFLGIELITKVPATLHTPLMSGSNAISGITIVGAIGVLLTQLSVDEVGILPFVLAAIALFLATINVVGGFVVSHRMLEKFRGKK